MGLLERITQAKAERDIRRLLKSIAASLERIANAMDRSIPATSTLDSIEVEDVSPSLQAAYQQVETELWKRLGREPTPEEVLEEYEQVQHLFPGAPQ